MNPKFCKPVLAEIKSIHSLGTSIYFEVVYHNDNEWCSFANSKTFEDGEIVLQWVYVEDAITSKLMRMILKLWLRLTK